MIMVVNMTKGKLEELEVLSCMNEGSFARIGANMEKKPKLMDSLITLADNCSQCSSVKVSSLISEMLNITMA